LRQVYAREQLPDVLGSAAFTPVKNDLLGNIKVRPIHYIAGVDTFFDVAEQVILDWGESRRTEDVWKFLALV
jgi:hypothetical protein